MITSGRVTVDGEVITELGAKADPAHNEIAVDGRVVVMPDETYAYVLNKPGGVLSSRGDDRSRPTVVDFAPPRLRKLLYPVGRLDLHSTGLILLTNDGELAFRLTHPSYHVPKTYLVQAERPLAPHEVAALQQGVEIGDGVSAPAHVTVEHGDRRRAKITLYEGRNRQIRRMLQAIGNKAIRLHRVAIGPLGLGELEEGHVRRLCSEEMAALRRAVGLSE